MTPPLHTQLRPGRPSIGPAAPAESVTTVAGRALQITWVAWIAYLLWAAAAAPDHPAPPTWVAVPFAVFELATWAAAGGLLARRRWALGLSALLALPMVAVAVLCVLSGTGNHWMAEAAVAGGVVAASFHPSSWRMHTR